MTVNKKEILNEYNLLCKIANRKLTRAEYRNTNPKFSSHLIESIFGSWSNFRKESDDYLILKRTQKTITFDEKVKDVVITYAVDGENINEDFLNVLKLYCDDKKAKLGILWGKETKKNNIFAKDVYTQISPYLATEFNFKKDDSLLVKDFLVPHTQKNPLLNIEKISTGIKTVVIGSTKQYLKILPYKNYDKYRVACTTGTISEVEYKETIAGYNDKKNHKYGAILLTWNKEQKRYVIRNLIYENEELIDLNKSYSLEKGIIDLKDVPAIVCGDLHLPEQSKEAVEKTHEQFKLLNPKEVFIHDVASWNSISHHESNKYLDKIKNTTKDTVDLETELNAVFKGLCDFTRDFNNIRFKIVNSNHDAFIEKWLNDGEFVKDKQNGKIGAKLFLAYLDNKNILDTWLPAVVSFLPKDSSYNICGFEVSEHGDKGISGARAGITTYNKSLTKAVIGHTHSCEINENTVVVGTLSNLVLSYNKTGFTKWVHCNCVIHHNGTFQLLFI